MYMYTCALANQAIHIFGPTGLLNWYWQFVRGNNANGVIGVMQVAAYNTSNKSNLTADAIKVEANVQERLFDHFHFRKRKCC